MEFQIEALSLIYIIIALLYAFVGLKKGFSYTFLYLVAPIIILLTALVFAQPLGRYLADESPFGEAIYRPIYEKLINASPYFKEEHPGREMLASVLSSGDYEAIVGMGVPSYLAPIIAAMILASVPVRATTRMIGEYVCEGATFGILYVISAVLLNTVLTVLLRIIKKMNAKKKAKLKKEGFNVKPNILSRLVGIVLGVGVAAANVFFISYVIELLFMPDPQLRAFINTIWFIDDPNVMTIGKYIMLNNPLKEFLLNLFQYFNF